MAATVPTPLTERAAWRALLEHAERDADDRTCATLFADDAGARRAR